MGEKEPREHGLIFGRGDDLGDDVEDPPTASPVPQLGMGIPGYTPAPIAFGDPPPEPVTIVGDVPWELQDGSESDQSGGARSGE